MTYKEDSEDFGHGIKADRRHAQILIKTTDLPRSDKEAEKLIESLSINIVSKSRLSTNWVLFILNVGDMRDAALKLTERGCIDP